MFKSVQGLVTNTKNGGRVYDPVITEYRCVEQRECEKHGMYDAIFSNGDFLRDYEQRCPHCAKEAILKSKLGGRDGIAKRFQRCSFGSYEVSNDNQATVKEILEAFARDFEMHFEEGTPVLLLGGVGTGKTHLACSIANEIAKRGYNSVFRSVAELIRSIRACWGSGGKEEAELIEFYKNVDLLIIDEVGVQAGSDNERNILFDIINGRYEEMKPTILISNETIDGFTRTVGQRIASRLQQDGIFLPFSWSDYRVGG